ncbi:efflux RND transporter permease subunit [Nevskia ramosa]|uniref:efflux RND transporter permease subunit n=1 Tax=Nevskia ramosa TaxID=64002 RepID=UPI003D10FB16
MTSAPTRGVAAWIIDHPRRVLLLGVLLALLLLAGVGRLQYVADADTTLPDHSALTAEIRELRSVFGSNDSVAFLIDGSDFAHHLRAACVLTAALAQDPDVLPRSIVGVGAGATHLLINDGDALDIQRSDRLCGNVAPDVQVVLDSLGPQREFLVGTGEALAVYADLRIDNGAYLPFRARADGYQQAGAVDGVRIRMTGQPSFLSAMQVFSQRMAILFPIVMLVIGLLHWEALRSLQAVILPLATGLLATALTLGSMGWAGVTLDEYSSTAPILILAVAAGHSVQLLKRYMEELAARCGEGPVTPAANRDALVLTVTRMAPVLMAAVVTAALCLFSLASFDIKAVARFGLVAGSGLLFALVIELSLMPAFRALRPPLRVPAGFGALRPHWTRLLLALHRQVLATSPSRALLILLPLLVGAGLSLTQLRETASVLEPFAGDIPERQALDAMRSAGLGGFPLDIVIDGGGSEAAFDPRVLRAAERFREALIGDPGIAAVASPVSVMAFLKCRFAGAADCTQIRIDSSTEATQWWTLNEGPGQPYPLIDDGWRRLRLRAFAHSDNSQLIAPIEARLRAVAREQGVTIQLGGPAMMAKALGDGIFRATRAKVVIIIAISGLAGCLLFRSWLAGLLFMVPSAVSALAAYSFLALTGTTLNIATASIAALAVGVGVDYLIYFTYRLREQLAAGRDWDEALRATYLSAGGASLCVATAVIGGYAVLIVPPGFNVHRWLGELIPLSIAAGLIATLLLYPLLLNWLRPAFLMRARHAAVVVAHKPA